MPRKAKKSKFRPSGRVRRLLPTEVTLRINDLISKGASVEIAEVELALVADRDDYDRAVAAFKQWFNLGKGARFE